MIEIAQWENNTLDDMVIEMNEIDNFDQYTSTMNHIMWFFGYPQQDKMQIFSHFIFVQHIHLGLHVCIVHCKCNNFDEVKCEVCY